MLEKPGLEDVGFLLNRETMPCNGDLECAFLDGITALQRHSANASLTATLFGLCTSCEAVVVVRNPDLVLDADLPARLAKSIAQSNEIGPWSLVGAGGLGLYDRRHMALYASECPAIPQNAGPQPVIDLFPDLYVVNAAFLRGLACQDLTCLDQALEPALATLGYLGGRLSVFIPDLAAGINGNLMSRDLAKATAELTRVFADQLARQSIETLSGSVKLPGGGANEGNGSGTRNLHETIVETIAGHADTPSLSVVTRTRFDRMHLLRRMLSSISRARRDDMALEVVMCTDADPQRAEEAYEALDEEFVNLKLRLKLNPPRGHSRVTNLMGGIQVAAGEYVMFLDDDDYLDLFAFETIRTATFAGNRPVIALTSLVHEETWEKTPSGRWILSHSMQMNEYPASGWRQMFAGVNKLPICGLLFSRARLRARLKTFPLQHDLSEDYALFLLMLTDPDLVAVHECSEPAVHISIRDSENSVLMPDRRPWVQDITRYLSDLTQNPNVAGPGQWALLAQSESVAGGPNKPATTEMQALLDRREQEIRLLRSQLARLRDTRQTLQEQAA